MFKQPILQIHVKIRGPNQGLGSIPASKKWGSGIDPRVHKMLFWDLSFRVPSLLWDQSHNSFYLALGLDPGTSKS